MASCIVQLHYMTGCNGNSCFYGKGKKSVYDQVMKSPVAQPQLSRSRDSLDLDEEVVGHFFEFTRQVIYGDHRSKTMAEAHTKKWKSIKNKSFLHLPPDADSLCQHCLRPNYLAYLMWHPFLKHHPSPIGHCWELVDGRCRPVRHTQPALPKHLPSPSPAEASEEAEIDYDDGKDDDVNQNALIRTDHVSQCHDNMQHNTKRKM
ncbi:hypothetical protein SK128_006975, partial [Halocaridina rubra]